MSESLSVVSDSLWPHGQYSPWNSPGKNTGVESHSLLQGIFLTQRLNLGLLPCRKILYCLSHQESPQSLNHPGKLSRTLCTPTQAHFTRDSPPCSQGPTTPKCSEIRKQDATFYQYSIYIQLFLLITALMLVEFSWELWDGCYQLSFHKRKWGLEQSFSQSHMATNWQNRIRTRVFLLPTLILLLTSIKRFILAQKNPKLLAHKAILKTTAKIP